MFIRFATDHLDADTGLPSGVFCAAYQILDGTDCDDYFRDEIDKTLDWFNTNLPKPKRFTRSRKPNRQDRGVCWFKSEARSCLSTIRYLVHLIREQDIIVRVVRTKTPGYKIYEDDCQIVAEPFSSTPR